MCLARAGVEHVSVLKKAELAVGRVVRASSDEEKRVVACGALVREAVVHKPWVSRGSHIQEYPWLLPCVLKGLAEVKDPGESSIGGEVEAQCFREDFKEGGVQAVAVEEGREMGQGLRASAQA